MRNYRFYLEGIKEGDDQIIVQDFDLLHKMNNVLRLSKSSPEDLEFIDGKGGVYEAELEDINKKEAKFKLTKFYESQRELKSKLIYFIPVIKPENYYWMLRKLTELGVTEFQPVFFKRSQKKYKESLEKQIDKAKLAIKEAVEQCGGAVLAKLNPIKDFDDLDFSQYQDCTKIFAYEELSLTDIPVSEKNLRKKDPQKVQGLGQMTDTLIMVGPEGGLTTDETDELRGNEFIAVSLGVRLLKAETAALTLFTALNLD